MSLLKKSLITVFVITLLFLLVTVVFRPVFSNIVVTTAKKSARGQFVCSVNDAGRHEGKLYKFIKGKKQLVKTFEGENCIFSRPKVNAGFWVLLIGGGGGATPYENGKPAQIVSKHKRITEPVITITVGKGGNGTYFDGNKLIDATDGTDSKIDAIDIRAVGGSKSTRMTPLGNAVKLETIQYTLPEKYRYLYDIPSSAKYGAGGIDNKQFKSKSVKAQNGQNGIVVIQW